MSSEIIKNATVAICTCIDGLVHAAQTPNCLAYPGTHVAQSGPELPWTHASDESFSTTGDSRHHFESGHFLIAMIPSSFSPHGTRQYPARTTMSSLRDPGEQSAPSVHGAQVHVDGSCNPTNLPSMNSEVLKYSAPLAQLCCVGHSFEMLECPVR